MNPLRIAINWVNYRRTISELSNLSNDTLLGHRREPLPDPQHRGSLLPLIAQSKHF